MSLLRGKKISLRPIRISDVNSRYVGWLNDPEVTRYLEVRFGPQTLRSVRDYVSKTIKDPAYAFFAIVDKRNGAHVGNIKLGPINRTHGFADMGIVIGEKAIWGKGYATEAIALATRYAFTRLGLHRLEAGAYSVNTGSTKAFLRAGWRTEGRERRKFLCGGKFVDRVRVACVRRIQRRSSFYKINR